MSSFVVSVIVVVAVIAGCTWLAPAPSGAASHQRATRPPQRERGSAVTVRPVETASFPSRLRAGVSLLGLLAVIGVLVAVAVGVGLVALDALLQRAAGA